MHPLAKNERIFLLMYPLFVFPYLRTLRAVFSLVHCFYADPRQASAGFGGVWPQGYVDKGRLSLPQPLIDAPFRYKHSSVCFRRLQVSGPPLPENLWRIFSFDFLFKFAIKTAIFGRSLAQSILATLLLYPFGVKEAQKGGSLAMCPLVSFA